MGNFMIGSLKWYWVLLIMILATVILWFMITYLTIRMNNFATYTWWSNGKGKTYKNAFNINAYVASKENKLQYSLASLSTPPLAQLSTTEYYFIYNYLSPLFRNNIGGVSYGCLSPYNLTQSIAFSMDDASPDPRFAAWINSGCARRGYGGGFMYFNTSSDATQLFWYKRKVSGWSNSPSADIVTCVSCGGSQYAIQQLNKYQPWSNSSSSGRNAQFFLFCSISSSYWAIPYWEAWQVDSNPNNLGPSYAAVDECTSNTQSTGGLVAWSCSGSFAGSATALNPTYCTKTQDPDGCQPYPMGLRWYGMNAYDQLPDLEVGPYPGTSIPDQDNISWLGLVMEWANGGSGSLPANNLGNATTYVNLENKNLPFDVNYAASEPYQLSNSTVIEPNLQFGPTAVLTEVVPNQYWYPASMWGFQMVTDSMAKGQGGFYNPNATEGGNTPQGIAFQFSGDEQLGMNQAQWWVTPTWAGNEKGWKEWSEFITDPSNNSCTVGTGDWGTSNEACNVGIGFYYNQLPSTNTDWYKQTPCGLGSTSNINNFPGGINLGNVAWYRGYCVAYYTVIYTSSIGSDVQDAGNVMGGYVIYPSYNQVLGGALDEYCSTGTTDPKSGTSMTNDTSNTPFPAPVSTEFGPASYWMCSSGQYAPNEYNWNDGYADNFLSRAGIMPTSTQLLMWFNASGSASGQCQFMTTDASLSCSGFAQLVANPTSGQPGGWINFLQSNVSDDVDALYNVIWGSLPIYIQSTPLSESCHKKKSTKKQKTPRAWMAGLSNSFTTALPSLMMVGMMMAAPEAAPITAFCVGCAGAGTGILAGVNAVNNIGNNKEICSPG